MSAVPAWKQAILDRKKKAEQEQRKKEQEEAAYLASLPPWKRAIVKKQRENQSPTSTLERKDSGRSTGSSSAPAKTTEPSNKWMAAVQKAREGSPKSTNRPSWARNASPSTPINSQPAKEVTPSSVQSNNSPKLASRSFSGAFSTFASKTPTVKSSGTVKQASTVKPASSFNSGISSKPTPSTTSSTPSSQFAPRMGRRESVTVLPTSDTPIAASSSPVISGGVSLRSKESKPTVHVSDKRRSFEGEEDEDAKLAAMPAWKKALILRRRAAAGQQSKEPKPQPLRKETPAPQKTLQPVKEDTPKQIKKETAVKETPKGVSNTRQQPVQNFDIGNDEVDSPYTEPITPQKDSYVDHTPSKATKATKARQENRAPQKPRDERRQKPQEERKVKPNTTVPASKSPSAKPITTKKTQSKVKPVHAAPKRPQPEIVNRPRADSEGPSKLVEKEGVVHRPPVYKEVDEWKNVSEDDPAFKKLPLWKQALIKRRRNDIANRSRTVAPEPSKQQRSSSTTARASTGQTDTQNIPSWKAELLKRNSTTGNDDNKNLSNRFTSSNSGSSKLQPVRKAPTPARSAPPPPEKEEPMFTFSFSKKHRTLDAGSESEDSDSDLEDVTVTNIDDASDEDSGIGKDGGIVVMSYKVTNDDYIPPVSSPTRSQTANANTKNEQSSMPRSESKSILIDPKIKPKKHLRRVSFSDSALTEEHFYPKYTYHDYDDVNSDNEDGGSHSSDSGISQRIHPSLLPSNETDSDSYRYSPSKISPMKPSSLNSSLGQYTPKMSGYYTDMLQNHLSGSSSYGSRNSSPSAKQKEPEEPVYNGRSNDTANDFYSHLNADTAALLW